VLLAGGLVLRILIMRSSWSVPDGDEATGMLMAQRAAHGQLSVFFWGANYGGALISWIEAPLVRLFGLHIWVFRAVDTIVVLANVLLLRAIAKRFMSDAAANLAAILFWFLPFNWVFWSSREYVFWVPGMFFALATVWAILKWRERAGGSFPFLIGLLLGATYWLYPLYLCLVGPAVVAYAWSERRRPRILLRSLIMVPVGGLPWVVANIRHHLESFHHPLVAGESSSLALRHAVTQVLPAALVGGKRDVGLIYAAPLPGDQTLRILGLLVMLAAAVWVVWYWRAGQRGLALMGVSVLLWPILLVVAAVPESTGAYRYALVLVPVLALMVARVVDRGWLPLLVAAVVVAGSVVTIGRETRWYAATPSCPASLSSVSRYLQTAGRDQVWGSYWLSAPLDVCSGDRIVASPTTVIRDRYAMQRATAAGQATFIVFSGQALDQALAAWAQAHPGAKAAHKDIGGFSIWLLHQPATPDRLGLPASAF
jgi:4-amino-4-deoxy-L-arabinose transferase-like glycosyltransferase